MSPRQQDRSEIRTSGLKSQAPRQTKRLPATVRIAIDAMGGDHAPRAMVLGAVRALAAIPDPALKLVLVGDEARINDTLREVSDDGVPSRLGIVHASQIVAMDEPPVEALRTKKDSSLVRMVELAAAGEVDAVLSAGNTGACAAACQLMLKPLPCVSRPGIAVAIPSFSGPFVLCDVGANIQAKPRHLVEYAVMAGLYAHHILGVASPRVGLISIGEERRKGTELVKRAHELLAADETINFVGNVEGQELFAGRCDVAVCDGFVGNIVLKFAEALAEGLLRTIAHEFDAEPDVLRSRFRGALDRVWQRHDYSQYGGAPLLGVNGVCIICHGRSSEIAVLNAVKVAKKFVEQGFNDSISEALGRALVGSRTP